MNRRLRVAAVLALGLAVSGAASTATVPLPVLEAIQGRPVGWAPNRSRLVVVYLKGRGGAQCGFEGATWRMALVSTAPAAAARRSRSTDRRSNVRQRAGLVRAVGSATADIGGRIHALTTPSIRSAGYIYRVAGRGSASFLVRRGSEVMLRRASSGLASRTLAAVRTAKCSTSTRFSGGRYRLIARR